MIELQYESKFDGFLIDLWVGSPPARTVCGNVHEDKFRFSSKIGGGREFPIMVH